MDLKRFWKKINKPVISAAVVILLLLLFVLLTGQDAVSPDNPMEKTDADASMMYLTSSTLAMDESLLDGVENANISSGAGEGNAQNEAEMQEPEVTPPPEEQEKEEQLEETQMKEEQQQFDDTPSDTSPDTSLPAMDSLISLIEKNEDTPSSELPDPDGEAGENGAQVEDPEGEPVSGGGQHSTLSPESSSELFKTSIVDGERVTDPKYYFTITLTAKGRAQNLVSQTVTVNGTTRGFSNGDSITLKEGANSIVVTLRFRDKNYNQIDAPTKSYTVYYVPENTYFLQVQNVNTGEYYTDGISQNIFEKELVLRIYAMKGTENTGARFRLNNTTVSAGEDGIFRMNLKVGNNTLKAMAGTGINQKTITFYLNYQPETFTLTMESAAVTETIQGSTFGKYTYAEYRAASPEFAFRISCSNVTGLEKIQSITVATHLGTTEMVHMTGANGYIQCDLDATQTTEIKVLCYDAQGVQKNYTWRIKYIRSGETPENKKPIIEANLANGEVIKSSPYQLTVHGKDYLGNPLSVTQLQVILNGQTVAYSGISGNAYEYDLYPIEGNNLLQIVAVDTEQYRAVKEIPFVYQAEVEMIDVTLIVDANVLNLGTLIRENLSVPSDTTIAQFLEERLAANGYTTSYDGSPNGQGGDYYLKAIAKPGILNNWHVSEERVQELNTQGYGFSVPENMNELREKNFTDGSGWMICLNNYFIAKTMGTRAVRDGDVIHVQFTLDVGGDIGVDPSGGIYG